MSRKNSSKVGFGDRDIDLVLKEYLLLNNSYFRFPKCCQGMHRIYIANYIFYIMLLQSKQMGSL